MQVIHFYDGDASSTVMMIMGVGTMRVMIGLCEIVKAMVMMGTKFPF